MELRSYKTFTKSQPKFQVDNCKLSRTVVLKDTEKKTNVATESIFGYSFSSTRKSITFWLGKNSTHFTLTQALLQTPSKSSSEREGGGVGVQTKKSR